LEKLYINSMRNLKEVAPNHSYLVDYAAREAAFERAAGRFAMQIQD
jgi:hypothetical protein